jgi:hypothetical protein
MKNIKIENAKRNAVIAFGPDAKQARIRPVKGEPGLYEVIVFGDAGAHQEFRKGETVSVGTADEIKAPKVCDGEGYGHHTEPEFMWWTPTETKAYCRKCAGARNRQINAEKKAGTWVPSGKKFKDPLTGDLTEAGRERMDAMMKALEVSNSRTADELHAVQIRTLLNGSYLRRPRKGEQASYNLARITALVSDWGVTWEQAVALVPELGDSQPVTWKAHKTAYPKRTPVVEEDAA